jgi:Ca2+-binding RTX toxin-like protein
MLALALLALSCSQPTYTASNTVSPTRMGAQVLALDADDIAPQQCASLALATLTSSGDAQANLLLATASPDMIDGLDGDDCIVGGGGDDTIDGGAGTDVCIGGPGTDAFTGCETQIQ